MHISEVHAGDYIVKREYDNSLTDGTIIFYEKKRYKIISIERYKNIIVFYIASEKGRYQLLFNMDTYSSIDNGYKFVSLSEERIDKIKTIL